MCAAECLIARKPSGQQAYHDIIYIEKMAEACRYSLSNFAGIFHAAGLGLNMGAEISSHLHPVCFLQALPLLSNSLYF